MSDGWMSEPIAIIGMSSKFAGEATDNEGLWRMLANGRSGWTPFPHSRFGSKGVYHPNNERLNSTHVKGAHFLEEDVGLFDANFFGYSAETASSLDPQYRLQLESVYEAIESAGLPLAQIAGSNTSVFTGVFVHDYRDGLLRDPDNLPRLMATGTGVPMMSNRISHFFDLHGTSMTIETACSSGMVALHQGIQSLRTHEADLSIVGGANLTLNPDMFKALSSSGFLSGDGKCYAFDSRASGYGRGEGVATLLIKRLREALADGDPIRAVIRESLLNQDGKTETITAPSVAAQEALIRDCYRRAGLLFGGSRGNPLLIGSIKTNIGHTEAASGLASIIKTALAMERGVIPPSINFEKPNPKIALDDWNLKLVTDLMSWPSGSSRRASVNNFGYGGTNAHIIMESSTLAYTLGQRRSRFSYVAAYPVPVTKGVDAVIRALDSPAFKPSRNLRRPRIGMVFTGQGAQWHATSLEMAGAYLEEFGANWSLLEELSRDADTSRVNEVALSTPICIAVQISLLRLLHAWGIVPVAVTSHSSGEIAAAYAVGALSFREAMAISYYRAVLAAGERPGRAPGQEEGAMIAVGLGVDETESYLRRLTQTNGKAVIACINSPSSTTVSGDVSAIKELEELANVDGVFARRLRINTAWHSHHMVSVAEDYIEAIDRAKTPGGEKDATAWHDDHHLVAFSSPVTVRKTDAQGSMQALAAGLLREGYPVDMDAVNFPNGRNQQDIKVLTTLPLYPWNHQNKHWIEPRFNRALRARSEPPHDLLGSLVDGSNPEAPSWRHILRITDAPWTQDHVIQSSTVFPAAGYICLAIEAVRQLSMIEDVGDRLISGYRLRDVDFMQALLIPNGSDGIEIQTQLRTASNRDLGARGWKHFEVWTVTADNRWTQHAKGLVSVEFDKTPTAEAVEPSGSGSGSSHSVVTMAIPDTSVPNDLARDPVVHPVALDSIITAPYSTLSAAAARQATAKVPRAVESFWVSSEISHRPGHLLRAHSCLVRDDSQGMEADVSVFDHDSGNLVLEMGRFSYQSLGRGVASVQQTTEPWEKELNSLVKWAPDISTGSPATFALLRKQLGWKDTEDGHDDIDDTRKIWQICVSFMQQAIANLDSRDADRMEPRYAKYYAWMVDTVQQAASGQLCIGGVTWVPDEAPGNLQRHMDQVTSKTRTVDVEMVCLLGAHLVDILRGEVPPLPLMAQDNLLARFYDNMPRLKRTGSQLSGLLAHLVHKNPRARILEIGAGTGTMTRYALSALGTPQTGGPAADSYHYTDASAALFDTARETLAPWSDVLVFDVLDPEREPAAQGFAHGTYDVVIASGVVSTNTNSVSRTLGSARNLLKPGGALLLTEVVQDKVLVPFVQALLFPERQAESDTVLVTDVWDRHLRDAGFSGVSLELRDCSDSPGRASTSVTIMSTVPLPTLPEPYVEPENVLIVTSRRAAPPPFPWLKGLQALIGECISGGGNLSVATQDLEAATASSYAHKFCIFIGEVNKPILHDLDPAALEGIQTMCTACKGLLWLTRGGAVDCERPEFSLASGFIRTLRTEHVARRLLTLDLDPAGAPWSDSSASAIVQVLRAALFDKAEAGSIAEPEYAERDGVMLVPRFYHDAERDQALSSRGVLEHGPDPTLELAPKTSIEPFHQRDRLLCLQPETLAFGDDEDGGAYHDSPLPPNLLEVEPRAYSVSSGPGDRQNHIRGLECAGIVTRVGSGAAAQGYKVGDSVVCVLHQKKQSSFPSRFTVERTATVHKPTNLSFQEAVSVPLAFLSAYFSLVEVARLQRAQWVLIHAAAEPTGQAAIMIAQHVEAKVLATVDSPEQRATLTEKYGIPAESIFMLDTSGLSSFEATILAATQDHGVDVVLNSLGGQLLQQSFNLVAPFGHFVEISGRDSKANSNLEMRPFSRSVSFTSVDLDLMLEHRVADVHRCLREIMRMVEVRAYAPVHPIVSYALGDVLKASRLLQEKTEPGFTGKVVLSVDQDARVPVLQVPRRAKLAGDASYLIVGGNGGLGQLVARWMASRGARNLILLSRSAARSGKMAALVRELREAGCHVLPVDCDVADEDDLAQAIQKSAAEGLPPIRGVVHAAFVLRDAFVEKMTFQDWKDTTQSKVAGAWNLHNYFNLPDDLDFFVLFSSINGLLGYASQAAYSAGGAYEDALAHWRVKQCGLPAVSIDLPVVDTVGYVAEASSSEKLRRSLVKAGHRPIDVNGVLASLESAIQRPFNPQFAVGINSGPGSHWDVDGALGRDPRSLALKYRPLTQAAAQQQQQQQQQSLEEGGGSLAARMTACTSRDDGIRVVGEAITEVLAEMFLVPVEDIDLSESPAHQGIDSLMAVELRNVLFSQAGAEISIFNIMQAPSLVSLATDVVGCSRYIKFAADSL
ncbi:hypothetical protein F5144DRAFT_540013 [Chaetomium tenue]|uniref:Uncharacterized protein n=1 Tax=Chaetomium tenue TaxID=1854479 RepID=A0ACB7NZM0_9PEZI|nr:hypothetical protein F5144DRAFT_540013 [Chaetomium globosum]